MGSITARGQAVESAKKISEQFVQTRNNDGLLGLAFSAINTGMPLLILYIIGPII